MLKVYRKEANSMDKLKITVVSESCVVENMAGCGKNNSQLCGSRDCSFNGGAD